MLFNPITLLSKFEGHCYLVRRCLEGEGTGETGRMRNGIVLPDFVADHGINQFTMPNCWAQVLAVGPGVGKPRSDALCRRFQTCRHFGDYARQGDVVLCEHMGRGIVVVPELGFVYNVPPKADASFVIVEESRVLAIYQAGEEKPT